VLELEQGDCMLVAPVLRMMRLNCMLVLERLVHYMALVENCKMEQGLVLEDCTQVVQVRHK